jgi:hypothetical protein
MKFQIILLVVEEVFRLVVEMELDGIVGLCLQFLGEGDGGEGEGSLQVFVVMVVGNLGVSFILGGELEAKAEVASVGANGDDINRGLLPASRAFSTPVLLLIIVLAHSHAH